MCVTMFYKWCLGGGVWARREEGRDSKKVLQGSLGIGRTAINIPRNERFSSWGEGARVLRCE